LLQLPFYRRTAEQTSPELYGFLNNLRLLEKERIVLNQHTALGATVAVCLGSGTAQDGSASETTSLRALAATALARSNPEMTIILSGDGRKAEDPALRSALKTEATIMAEILSNNGISAERLLLEDESRDTIGNAILTTARFLHGQTPRRLYIVTSPFHIKRALASFQGVLGSKWEIIAHPCAVATSDEVRGATEQGGIDWTDAFYQGITEGDLQACINRLLEKGKPYYRTLGRLQLPVRG
jgi:uncharacterized SAM-binding protein YcdF (DUF218 family)